MAHCVAHAYEVAMKVKVISILEDNYMYLVIEEQSKQAVAVDPAVPHRVSSYGRTGIFKLKYVFIFCCKTTIDFTERGTCVN